MGLQTGSTGPSQGFRRKRARACDRDHSFYVEEKVRIRGLHACVGLTHTNYHIIIKLACALFALPGTNET